jgi:hypothetical protein
LYANTLKNSYPILNVHGDDLPNSCSPSQKKKLQDFLTKQLNKNLNPDNAWRLIETMLCAEKTENNQQLIQHIVPSKIRLTTSASGDKDAIRWIKKDDDLIDTLMSKGQAWDAQFEFTTNKVILRFAPNEACMRTRTMQFIKNKWSLIAISEACD